MLLTFSHFPFRFKQKMTSQSPIQAGESQFLRPHQDLRAVNRFFDELKAVALFFGPHFSEVEAVISAHRIWPRYFGRSSMPYWLLNKMDPAVKAVADEGVLYGIIPIKRRAGHCYPLGPALYELVAITMYRRWYYRRESCPIPFEYPALVADRPPIGPDRYVPQCTSGGKSWHHLLILLIIL